MFRSFALALVAASASLATPAHAARQLETAALQTPIAAIPDLQSYRSPGASHKVLVERAQLAQAAAVHATRRFDYGAFALLELDAASSAALIASGVARNADAHNLILLNTGAIDTTATLAKSINASSAPGAGPRLHLVQYPGPIQPDWMRELLATGVRVVSHVPNNAYLIYGDASAIAQVNQLARKGSAQWAAPYLDTFKLQPGVSERAKLARPGPTPGPSGRYQVQLVRDPAANRETEALLAAGSRGEPWRYEILGYVNIVSEIPEASLALIGNRPDVVSIAVYVEPVKHDERQNMILAGNLTGNVPNPGNYFSTLAGWGFTQAQFTASGTIVDVTDDGADRNPNGADPGSIPTNANAGPVLSRHFVLRESGLMANASRFFYKGRWGSGSTADGGLGLSGHGQLNMSIVGGHVPDALDPTGTRVHRDPSLFRYGLGVAPFVGLANSVIFDPNFTGPNYPNMLSAGYAGGARISSNSWGASTGGAYTADSQAYDALVRDSQAATAANQEMIIVFSAGNSGAGANTVGSPGTGKNVLTVGAAENVHSFASANGGGNATGSDGCGIADTGADSANDVISFSSRGPTDDGRIKPEIQAPGTHVTGITFVTTTSSGTGTAEAAYRADGVCGGSSSNFFPLGQQWYTASSGTSHSAPAVAGGAALVHQQFLNNPAYIADGRTPAGSAPPSPAMVKAYLTNSARYMTGAAANDSLPSNSQGLGMMNLGMAFDGVARVTRDQVPADLFTATGQTRTHTVYVASGSQPVRISLAWVDAPGPTSGNAFVNNLDLNVVIGANSYLGNVFSGANSVTGGSADVRNNLESVFLPAGTPGGTPVQITVTATNIAGDGVPGNAGVLDQDYALVVYNATPTSGPADPTTTTLASSANPVLRLQPVTFTSTTVNATSSGPVTSGTVSFSDGLTPLCSLVPVNASGLASCTTSTLAAGARTITAIYNGDVGVASSSATLTQTVTPIVEFAFTSAAAVGDNDRLDPDDCNALTVSITNNGGANASAILATLGSSTPGVTITSGNSVYPNIAAGGSGSNLPPFQVSTDASMAAGSSANFALTLSYSGGGSPAVLNFSMPVGAALDPNYQFTNSSGQTIPAGGGLLSGSQTDDAVLTLAAPFDFSIYGTAVASGSNIRVSTNGHIRIESGGSGGAALSNADLPATGGGALPAALPSLLPYWDDLDMRLVVCTDCGIYTQVLGSAPARQWVVEWRARHYVSSQPLRPRDTEFAVIFNENSNAFRYVYGQTGAASFAAGASATVGVQAASTGTLFTQFSFNTPSLVSGLGLAAAIPAPSGPGPGVCANPPTQLAVVTQPSNTVAGVAISPAVSVRLLDAGGQPTTSTAAVTLAIGSNPGAGTLSGTTTVNAVAGLATFSNLSIDKLGTGYTLTAASAGLTGATSNAFNISAAAAAALQFLQQPGSTNAGAPITPAPSVRALDAFGNLSTFGGNIALAIGSNPGAGSLSGTTTVAASGGVASFPGLSINNPGTGYTLTAASAGLAGTTSSPFDIVCPSTLVTNGNDSGAGSLRQIIADACPGSTVTFQAGVTAVSLTSSELLIDKHLNIDASPAGVSVTRAAGSPNFRIFQIGNGRLVTLTRLTVSNGNASDGGGIWNNVGNLTLEQCVVSGNTATNTNGGGGGILNRGVLQATDTTISGNSAAFLGGGMWNLNAAAAASATLTRSTISGNAAFSGGGIHNQGSSLSLTNVSIANNSASAVDPTGGSAGLENVGAGFPTSAALVNVSFSGNRHTSSGDPTADDIYAGTFGASSIVTLRNTILNGDAGTATPNLRVYQSGVIISLGNNLSSDNGTGLLNQPGDQVSVNPRLAALGAYGGPTQTLALLPGSPALDAGTATGAPAEDQRGIARPQLGAVDIGAYESRGFMLALASGNNQSAGPGLAFGNPLAVSVSALAPGEPVNGGAVGFTPPGAGASASLAPNPAIIAAGSASSTATANATVGSYQVAASAAGAAAAVNFSLTNAGADLSINDVTVTEGDSGSANASFTVSRSNNLTAFSVAYATTSGSASAGSDYTATSGTLNFAVGGALTQTFSVPVLGELLVESNEAVTLALGTLGNTVGTTTIVKQFGQLVINDNDSAVVSFAPASVSQVEGTSPMAFTVTLSNPVQSGVSLSVNSAFGTATAADFTAISGGTLLFPTNANPSQTLNVVIADDALDEDDESYTLALSGLTAIGNVSIGAGSATGTIVDDDPLPTISISNPSQPEGNAGTSTMNFVVSLSAASGRDVSFTRVTVDWSATVINNDYLPIPAGIVTIPAGQTSLTIPVTINGDSVYEGDESFSLSVVGIVNATPGTLSGNGTILDDDQQPTTTTITADLPDPSVVGQAYPVSVTVAAVSSSPLGTLTISDGSASCGPVSLVAGSSPNSSASCNLTSTSAGAKVLSASYTPASSAFAASTGTATHQVNPASTTISVSGPPRSRINQPVAFSFALAVNAPGAGTPSGTVTLGSGASSCTATLPATSCNLAFTSLGSRTVSASYAGDANFSASTSSGAGNAQTLVYALADLSISKSDGQSTYVPGDLIVYSVLVRNLGPDAAANIRVGDSIPAGLVDVVWSCDASGGASCPVPGGSGNLDLTIASLPVGALLNFTFYGNVDGSPAQIANIATLGLPADTTVEDPALANNSASDTDLLDGLFANGFESAQVNAASGSLRVPGLSLARVLADEASLVLRVSDARGEGARVYARLHGATLQYALAQRGADGRLRLGAWLALPGEPTLSWTARPVAAGWELQSVLLR